MEDFHTVSEFSTFVQQKASYAAEEGFHDDMVMCLVIFAWLITQKYFRESIAVDIRKALETDMNMALDDSMVPFGFIDNGLSADTVSLEDGDLWQDASDMYGNRTQIDSRTFTPRGW